MPLAIGDIVSALGSPSTWGRLSHEPQGSLAIPDDFFGINIATSDDERCDDYVTERLQELNIRNVRLAFSYGGFDGPAVRFLDKLLDREFVVSLVVLPPLEEAGKMLEDRGVQEKWRRFVTDVFDRYATRVAVFEIGSTPNRKKWSGFRPRGYLQAWEIACDAAKDHAVSLAGPNIQDFEPFYNAAFLFAMRRLGRLPEMHTDNLFVERVIEPEAYDHRALGKLATELLKLNLVKKARLLQNLGNKAGCKQTICTCTFWSTKRLGRWSLHPQEKKADYLARYLVLTATSGALGRVYWGPMICARDGLIDDGAAGYPEVDNSTFYQRVRGDVSDFNVTPAFFALRYITKRLRSAYCDKALSTVNGISHFAFTGIDKQVFHVCWCRDGHARRLTDLYSEEQMAAAVFTDACGKTVWPPLVVNERPLVIDFPGLTRQQLPESLAEMNEHDSQIVYAHLPELQGVPWENERWRGAFTATAKLPIPTLGDDLTPEVIAGTPELAVLRNGRNRLWNVAHPHDENQQLTVKFNRPRGIKRLVYRYKPSKGRRHWNNASTMLQRGVRTPTPIAFYERHHNSGVRDNYYICEFVPDAFSSRHVCAAFRKGEEEFRGLDKHQWFDLLNSFILKMHNARILHRDLSVGNLMLRQEEDGGITPYLIDIGRAKVLQRNQRGFGGRHRLLDLMRICYKLDWPNRELFIQYYNERWGSTLPRYWRLALSYYDFKQGTKKYVKAKLKKKR